MGKVMPSLENINSETQTEFHKNKLKGGIPVLCTKQKRDMANSIFQIEKVEGDTERICRQGSATFQLYLSYYTYLNRWAISFPVSRIYILEDILVGKGTKGRNREI